MCNIAGYIGSQQAAPILLEMLRRQQPYDGDMSTGIATVHEGKLYYRKMVGDVDNLIRNSDVLDLPGTIGIAHTRPSGSNAGIPYHPFLSPDETMRSLPMVLPPLRSMPPSGMRQSICWMPTAIPLSTKWGKPMAATRCSPATANLSPRQNAVSASLTTT